MCAHPLVFARGFIERIVCRGSSISSTIYHVREQPSHVSSSIILSVGQHHFSLLYYPQEHRTKHPSRKQKTRQQPESPQRHLSPPSTTEPLSPKPGPPVPYLGNLSHHGYHPRPQAPVHQSPAPPGFRTQSSAMIWLTAQRRWRYPDRRKRSRGSPRLFKAPFRSVRALSWKRESWGVM